MVRKGVIVRNLREIEALYNEARSNKKKHYFAKLAILELCGWLESTQDDLIRSSAGRCISLPPNQTLISSEIKRTHGFDYEQNFRRLLILIVGLSQLEKVEQEFDKGGSLAKLVGLLSKLKESRNMAAHTHTSGVLPTIDAPSVVRKNLEDLYVYLRQLERILKRLRF